MTGDDQHEQQGKLGAQSVAARGAQDANAKARPRIRPFLRRINPPGCHITVACECECQCKDVGMGMGMGGSEGIKERGRWDCRVDTLQLYDLGHHHCTSPLTVTLCCGWGA